MWAENQRWLTDVFARSSLAHKLEIELHGAQLDSSSNPPLHYSCPLTQQRDERGSVVQLIVFVPLYNGDVIQYKKVKH